MTATATTTETKKTPDEIKAGLDQFIGTCSWHRNTLMESFINTDGVNYLARECGAFWLLDVIASHNMDPKSRAKVIDQEFQTWRLQVVDREAVVYCGDGNGIQVLMQKIPFTDFPLPHADIWVIKQGDYLVAMLPSEY